MKILQPPQLDEPSPCPYLPGRLKRYEFFLAGDVDGNEVVELLAAGWRKFGVYYFRPACPGCRSCIPVRVRTAPFVPSRSQRRVLRKNTDLRVVFGPLRITERAFAIWREHSLRRFGDEVEPEEFLCNFYLPSCPCLQSEIYREEELVGIGLLDRGSDCLSSVYFCFDPLHASRNLGTFSILQEIAQARTLGLDYYYLGYFVPGSSRMAYKDHFRPREYFDWETRNWIPVSGPPARQN